MDVYEPREDSYLLQKYVETYSKEGISVLDMGTGSGIQGMTAAKTAIEVLSCDINPAALAHAEKEAKKLLLNNIIFKRSDLFSKVPKKKFDLIVFNPPYLPEDSEDHDDALVSGKKGTETTIRFLNNANEFLKPEGILLLITSSFAKQALIDEAIKKNLFEAEILEKVHVFFEDINILKLVKSDILKKLEALKIKAPKLFARGKRGVIIKAMFKSKNVAIKLKKDSSGAMGTIENETRFLKVLNKKGIGPKLMMQEEGFLMYVFVEGEFIFDFVKKNKKKDILIVLKKVFEQMYTMDKLGINKFEMHHPIKHILIDRNIPVLIDFERARYTEDPKNVTQFCDFLIGEDMGNLLNEKKITIEKATMIDNAKQYKHKPVYSNYKKLIEVLK